MDLVFEDDDRAIVGCTRYQMVCCVDGDVLAVAPEALHQGGLPNDHAWPAGEFVEDLVLDALSRAIEEVRAINTVAEGLANEIEVGFDGGEFGEARRLLAGAAGARADRLVISFMRQLLLDVDWATL